MLRPSKRAARPAEFRAGSNKPAIPQTYRAIAANYEVIVDKDIQSTGHIDEMAGSTNVGGAGLGISRGVVVRDHQPPGIQFKRPPHGPAQRQDCRAAVDAFVKVLGDEQPLGGQVKHHDTFLAAEPEAAHKVSTKARTVGLGRLADNRFARGQNRKFTSRRDGCGQQPETRRRLTDGFCEAGRRCGMDPP